MAKKLTEMAAEIIQAQMSTSSLSSDEIANSLRGIFTTLQELQKREESGEATQSEAIPREPADPMDSIQADKIVCLECGTEMRQLTAKHLVAHNMTPREYRKKWGIPLRQPLSAKSLSKARSKAAKKRGLPENLVKFQEERRQAKAPVHEVAMPVENAAKSETIPRGTRKAKAK